MPGDETRQKTHDESDSESDGAPEVISSKAAPDVPELHDETPAEALAEDAEMEETLRARAEMEQRPTQSLRPPRKPHARQPRKPLQNPFAARPSLLKNVSETQSSIANVSHGSGVYPSCSLRKSG